MSAFDPSFVQDIRDRHPRALARAISIIERAGPAAHALVGSLGDRQSPARVVGLTGPPGVGKSTLADQLITCWRRSERRVAVIAVDPTSVISGGAILGDRVRMQAHADDEDVFIRSMATRGHLGGLAQATRDAALVFDVAGFDIVLVETVGVGQDEVEVATAADVTVVVLVPGLGDELQAIKAGFMEIADIVVMNKADREGADHAAAALLAMLGSDDHADVRPELVRTVATTGAGVEELAGAIDRFAESHADQIAERRRRRVRRVDARAPVIVDHVGLAAEQADGLLAFFRDLVGLSFEPPEEVASQGARVRFAATAGADLEIIEPLVADSPLASAIRSRASGLHHLAFRVDDLESALDRLADAGVRLIDRRPRPGAHGRRIAFVHPSSTGGVLVELVEGARKDAHADR